MSKAESMARVTAAYLLAFGTATAWLVWGPSTDRLWLDALVADVLATVVVFAASRCHHNSSFYDAYWSVLPPYLAVYWVIASDAAGDDTRTLLVLAVVFLWAVRLTANWVIDFPGLHPRAPGRHAAAVLQATTLALGVGARSPGGRAPGLCALGAPVPVPGVVGAPGAAAVDRPTRYLQGHPSLLNGPVHRTFTGGSVALPGKST